MAGCKVSVILAADGSPAAGVEVRFVSPQTDSTQQLYGHGPTDDAGVIVGTWPDGQDCVLEVHGGPGRLTKRVVLHPSDTQILVTV